MDYTVLTEAYPLILLAIDIWREDRGGKTHASRVGIGWIVRNRVSHPRWWGTTIVEVITHKWQFSSITAPKDPNLVQWGQEKDPVWQDSLKAALEAMDPNSTDPTKGATDYYTYPLTAPPAEWGLVEETIEIDGVHFCKQVANA